MFKFPFVYFFVFIFVFFFSGACGKRGLPQPPSLVVPAQIDDLQVNIAPGLRHLVWSLPTVNADKSRPVDLKAFKVLLKKLPVDQDGCRYCDEGFYDYLSLTLAKPAEGFVLGSSFYLPLPMVPPDYLYIFAVLSLNSRGWSSELSNKLAVFSLPEVLPPTNLVCHPSASVVDLKWQPSIAPPHFKGSLSYRVYRRNAQNLNQTWRLITPEAITTPEYIDVGLADWSAYEYVVSTIVSDEDTLFESNLSRIIQVTPGDYSPPVQLENFTAFYYQGGIQLIWNPSPEADLAGYRVYRRDSVTGIDQLLAVLPPTRHEILDNHIVLGRTYYYRITAFDQSDRKNESPPSPEVSVSAK